MTFNCKCFKCGKGYESEKEVDTDGDGNCPSCFEETQRIAKAVDEKFKGRIFTQPKRINIDELPRIKGTNYINARDLL